MTQAPGSVVSIDRFRSGKTYQEYIESGIRNRDLFDRNYEGLAIRPDQEAALKELAGRPNGPHHLMVIGEDWCPDVYRGMPVAARIAEAMGIEMRVFERDQNKDIMAEFLNGEFESIPVFVFYDRDHRQVGKSFHERPAVANEQIHATREVVGDTSPEGIARRLGHEPSEEELRAARAEARDRYLEWQKGEMWASWRDATVDEVIGLLKAAL